MHLLMAVLSLRKGLDAFKEKKFLFLYPDKVKHEGVF
jgi:hypothetical protein